MPKKTVTDQPIARYELKALMNIRKTPDLSGVIVGTAPKGTIVSVAEIDKDWMKVTLEGKTAYILYRGGEYAKRI